FHTSVEAANDEPLGERLRDDLVVRGAVFEATVDEPLGVERRLDVAAVKGGSQHAAAHAVAAALDARVARLSEMTMRQFEGGADRAAGIARGRLDPDPIEVRQALQQAAVGDAIQRNPAGE